MNKNIRKFLIVNIVFIPNLFAWETDNYSTRVELLKQPNEIQKENLYRLNDKTNLSIQEALSSYNKNGSNCILDKDQPVPTIFKYIKNTLGGGFISGNLENWAANTKESKLNIPKVSTDIYSAMLWDPDPSLNLGGYITGTDKLGHFVDQGFDVFKRFKKLGGSIDTALTYSESMEETGGPYGLSASGVKSYGDLAANFSGFRFYQNLLSGNKPHITCNSKSGTYELSSPMNWADYIDESFDEGINCSLFISMPGPVTQKVEYAYSKVSLTGPKYKWKRLHKKRVRYKVSENTINNTGVVMYKNLKKLHSETYTTKDNSDLELNNFCPVQNKVCDELVKKNCANYVVSPQCYTSVQSKKNYSCHTPPAERPVHEHIYTSYEYPSNFTSKQNTTERNPSNVTTKRE